MQVVAERRGRQQRIPRAFRRSYCRIVLVDLVAADLRSHGNSVLEPAACEEPKVRVLRNPRLAAPVHPAVLRQLDADEFLFRTAEIAPADRAQIRIAYWVGSAHLVSDDDSAVAAVQGLVTHLPVNFVAADERQADAAIAGGDQGVVIAHRLILGVTADHDDLMSLEQ